VHSEYTAWKQLISRTLATDEHISLIMTIFSDRNQVAMAGRLSGDDAQKFIDVIDEVSPHTIPRPKGKVTQSFAFYPIGIGWLSSFTMGSQEVPTLFAQDLWPPSPAPKVTDNSTQLRPEGDPTVPWGIHGRVEGSIQWSGGCDQGSESILNE
jgi:hypothetical protein